MMVTTQDLLTVEALLFQHLTTAYTLSDAQDLNALRASLEIKLGQLKRDNGLVYANTRVVVSVVQDELQLTVMWGVA